MKGGIFAVSRIAYCKVIKYEGPGKSSHVRPETVKEIVDSAVAVGGS